MELSRQEYPALLTTLTPTQAVTVLNDRVTQIEKVNTDFANWLAERRRIEDIYAQSLRKLAASQQLSTGSLGVFKAPWQSIVSSCESLADSHETLARKIATDVERPLREFPSKNREMQSVTTMKGNLASLAKDYDEAQKKTDKIQAKGSKANSGRLSSALASVQEANGQWESQAPFVFESLQALDESRVNQLRDVLTQLQTHEVDVLERSRVAAGSVLEVLLNVSTNEEISAFVAQTSEGQPSLTSPRRASRPGTGYQPSTPSVPIPPTPNTATTLAPPTPGEDRRSDVSSTSGSAMPPPAIPPSPEKKKSSFGGLKRLGTVMGRRSKDKDVTPKSEKPVPEKRTRPSRNPLRRNSMIRDMHQIPSPNASMTELADTSARQTPRLQDESQPPLSRSTSASQVHTMSNGEATEAGPTDADAITNGIANQSSGLQERKPRPPSTILEEGGTGSVVDEITRAQQEAAATEGETPQFKLDIRKEPISEEDPATQSAAFSSVASTLRAQAGPTPRRPGTLRGRRDVRNTIFVPNPSTPELTPIPNSGMGASPFMNQAMSTEDRTADTQSIRSGHSLSSLGAGGAPRHSEMTQPGLNASIVETVSTAFEAGTVMKSMVVGELALVHNGDKSGVSKESMRLDNFPVLHKVAVNPIFVTKVPERNGEYILDLSKLSRTEVAFRYQVHLEDSSLAAHSPVVPTPSWRIEANQASVVLTYARNPLLQSEKSDITLQNVVVLISIENAKAISCQAKPSGTFSKDRNMMYWRLGDVTLEKGADTNQRILARFTTQGEAKPGTVEVRWEVTDDNAAGLGSGLGMSISTGDAKEEGNSTNPFADNGSVAPLTPLYGYKEVPTMRKLVSGKYTAV